MKSTKIFLLLILMLLLFESKAQTNFKRGYYITNSNDTIRGFIEYRSEDRNGKICVFKTTLEKEVPRQFYPKDILGYAIVNNYYESHQFVDKKLNEVSSFFKVIVRGKLSLLKYNKIYLAKTEDNKIYEISVTYTQEGNIIKKDYRGIGTLKSLINECTSIQWDAAISKPEQIDYKAIIEQYNQCVGSNYTKSEPMKTKSKLDYGVVVSPSLSKVSLGYPLDKTLFNDKFVMTGGGFASFFIPQVNEKLRLVTELIIGKHDQYSYFTTLNAENDVFINYWFLKIPLFARYEYKRFFIDAGLHDQFIIHQNIKLRTESVQSNSIVTSSPNVSPLPSISFGYLVGAGMNYTLAGRVTRTSVRYSQSPSTRIIELMLSVQLSSKVQSDY